MNITYPMDPAFLIFSAILPWKLFIGSPWLERGKQNQEATSPQARKEVRVWL
jgi:hypothetical protein